MAARSTRQKIKDQGGKCLTKLEEILDHLQKMQVLADGRSDHINKNLPLLVGVVDEVQKVFCDFYEGL